MAMRELVKASELDPENAEIDMMIGLVYQARGDLPKAEEHLRRAIGKKPDYADARNNLGIVLAQRMKWDEAIREFEAAAANVMYTTPERAYFNLGEAYRAKGVRRTPKRRTGARCVRTSSTPPPIWRFPPSSAGRGNGTTRRPSSPAAWRSFPTTPGLDGTGARLAAALAAADALKAFEKVLEVSSDPEVRKQAAGYVTLLGSGSDDPGARRFLLERTPGVDGEDDRPGFRRAPDRQPVSCGNRGGEFRGFPGACVLRRLHPLVREVPLAGSGSRPLRVRAVDRVHDDSDMAAQLRFGWVERERERGSRRATYTVAAGAVLLLG